MKIASLLANWQIYSAKNGKCNLKWVNESEANAPYEATFLKLDSGKVKKTFNWKAKWNIEKAIEKTVEWTKVYANDEDIIKCTNRQIDEFFEK